MAWLAPLLVLGLVILVHELGHFWAAKIFGVYAPRFAIGFGPALWRKRWGETEYVIGVLPLGGYVRMATRDDEATVAIEGELDESKGTKKEPLDPGAMIPFGPNPVPANRWFESKPLWQRAIILLAGVTMNVVLTVVVAIGIFAAYGRPYLRPVVASVVAGKPAANAGMEAGDSIAAVDGRKMRSWSEVFEVVSASPGRELELTVVRSGMPLRLRMIPEAVTDTDVVSGRPRQVGRVGMQTITETARERVSLIAAVPLGTAAAWRLGASVVDVLKGLVTGHISVTQLAGPVGIVRTSVAEAKRGWESLLTLIAFLSINLAVLNLVPIPLLDGGQLVLQTAETIKGSAFSDRTREWIARVGLAAIAALFLTVTFNDLKALIGTWLR